MGYVWAKTTSSKRGCMIVCPECTEHADAVLGPVCPLGISGMRPREPETCRRSRAVAGSLADPGHLFLTRINTGTAIYVKSRP